MPINLPPSWNIEDVLEPFAVQPAKIQERLHYVEFVSSPYINVASLQAFPHAGITRLISSERKNDY